MPSLNLFLLGHQEKKFDICSSTKSAKPAEDWAILLPNAAVVTVFSSSAAGLIIDNFK